MSSPGPQDRPELHGGFTRLVGLRFEEVSADRVVLTCPVTGDLLQPYGLVHGGVHATLAETAASVAGALWFAENAVRQIGKITTTGNLVEYSVPIKPDVLTAGAVNSANSRSMMMPIQRARLESGPR